MVMLKNRHYTPDNMGSNFGHVERVVTGADGVTRPRWEALWVDGLAEVGDRVAAAFASATDAQSALVALQALAAVINGALADTASVSIQGRALVAAATPTEACAVIGAASVADVQAALPAGLTYRIDQLNRLAALGAVGNKL